MDQYHPIPLTVAYKVAPVTPYIHICSVCKRSSFPCLHPSVESSHPVVAHLITRLAKQCVRGSCVLPHTVAARRKMASPRDVTGTSPVTGGVPVTSRVSGSGRCSPEDATHRPASPAERLLLPPAGRPCGHPAAARRWHRRLPPAVIANAVFTENWSWISDATGTAFG